MAEAGVRCGPVERSYPVVRERAARLASAMAELGVQPGDRVALVLRNDVTFVEATIAAGLLGVVPVPVNWHWKGAELRHLLTDSAATLVLAHSHLLSVVEDALAGPDVAPSVPVIEVAVPDGLVAGYGLSGPVALSGRHPDLERLVGEHPPWEGDPAARPAAMIYTSGTTGTPKGVERELSTPEQTAAGGRGLFQIFGIEADHRVLLPAPLYHTAPNTHSAVAAAAGLDLTIMARFDPEEFLRLVEEQRINSTQMVPTMFVRLLRLPPEVRGRYDLSSLRAIVHAAAPCPVDVKHAIIDWFGPIVREYYGGTESGAVVACDAQQWLDHPGTVGTAVADAEIRIYDDDGAVLPAGTTGHVYARPPSFWPNFTYRGDPAKRAAVERAGGFITVGDVGHLDADGYLYLSDRASDMVISGGVNIYPAEIEACLLSLPGVRDAAVFGIPDAEFGESLAAHVDVDPAAGLTPDDVRTHIRENLASYKVPRIVEFDANLPREDSGKLFKRKLKERYAR
ncbi:AMP-binding protein [Pseudonocardia sp. GCM10023141]|uniref:AMP-binding protein n=1 Tax=Pseudonocardia sp. GCM10023141 TaxID=3252653 RepID=UPI0036135637